MTNTEKSPEKIKLFNKGKSVIYYGDAPKFDEKTNKMIPSENKGSIKPDECVAFEPEMAAKLQRLYPKKLLSLEDVRAQFENKHKEPEAQNIQAIVAKAVADALAARDAQDALKNAPKGKGKKAEIKKDEPEETEEEILAKLEAEQAEAEAAKADKAAAETKKK